MLDDDKLKIESYLFDLSGGYSQFVDGIRSFHNKIDDKGFVIDNNTIAETPAIILSLNFKRSAGWMTILIS